MKTPSTPTLNTVQVGDQFTTVPTRYGYYISTVLSIDPVSTRFGKADRIVQVSTSTNDGVVVDSMKSIWVSQLIKGLV